MITKCAIYYVWRKTESFVWWVKIDILYRFTSIHFFVFYLIFSIHIKASTNHYQKRKNVIISNRSPILAKFKKTAPRHKYSHELVNWNDCISIQIKFSRKKANKQTKQQNILTNWISTSVGIVIFHQLQYFMAWMKESKSK